MTTPATNTHLHHRHALDGARLPRMPRLRRAWRRTAHWLMMVLMPVLAGVLIAALVFGLLTALVLMIG